MKSQLKKLTAIFLSICVVLSLTTVISFAATNTTISFASTAQRKSQTTAAQVWENGGVTFTNNKASSSTSVANYSNPVRLYQNSQIIVACDNMTKIVFDANNSSYATALKNSIGTVTGATVTVSSDKVTVTYTNPVDSLNIAKLTAQIRLDSLTVTAAEEQTEPVKATVKYHVFGNVVSTEEGVSEATLPTPSALPEAYADDYTFAGWAEAEADATLTAPKLYAAGEKVALKADANFYAVYTYKAKGFTAYVLTDVADIAATDTVVITMKNSAGVYALTNGGGTSSAPAATKVVAANNMITGTVADDLKWNIAKSGTNFADLTIYPDGVTNKWLYCTNNNNGVRVGTNTDKVFTITSGYLKHTAQGRYIGVYSNQDWRCYTTIHDNIKGGTLGFYVEDTVDEAATFYTSKLAIKGASLVVGSDLTANFYVADEYAGGEMTFTMNGNDTVVSQAQSDANGKYFAFEGIAPNNMTAEIKAELKAGGVAVGTFTTTVKDVAKGYLDGNYDDKIKTFVANMLNYGAASQNYTGENTNNLANSDVDGYGTTTAPAEVDGIGLSESETRYFKSANVWFANKNNIIVNLQNVPEGAMLFVNGEEVAFSGNSYTTEGLKATELDDVFTFELRDGNNNSLQTLKYSVNAYAYSKQGSASIGELAVALYNYGVAANAING